MRPKEMVSWNRQGRTGGRKWAQGKQRVPSSTTSSTPELIENEHSLDTRLYLPCLGQLGLHHVCCELRSSPQANLGPSRCHKSKATANILFQPLEDYGIWEHGSSCVST